MMSAPDKVDVDIPNTKQAKLTSVKSTENLRRLVPPTDHHRQQQHHKMCTNSNTTSNSVVNVGGGSRVDNDSPSSPRSIKSMPNTPSTMHHHQLQSQQHQHQQPLQQQQAEYTAWTIGSTESLQKHYANNSNQLLLQSGGGPSREGSPFPTSIHSLSPYTSALLAKCSNSRQPSPDLTEATISSVSPSPPPVAVIPQQNQQSTLGGLSQGLSSVLPSQGGGGQVGNNGGGGQQQQQLLHLQQNQLTSSHQQQQHQLHQQQLRSHSINLPPQYPKTPSPPPPSHHNNNGMNIGSTTSSSTTTQTQLQQQQPQQQQSYNKAQQLLYQTRLLSTPIPAVESLLSSSCESLNFDIAEMWLRTGPKTHQLTNSHVRPTALDESVRKQLVDVYYGDRSAERTHRLSPALCKRAKEAGDVVWVTAHTVHGAEALKCSISDVRTAVAVPVCHGGSGLNVTIIYFSIRR